MIALPPSGVATDSVQATASPPNAMISRTTSWAGPASTPSPFTLAPGSLTTTLAPFDPSNRAYSRPSPLPAPVITATRPSNLRSATGTPPLLRVPLHRHPDRGPALSAQRRDYPPIDVGNAIFLRQLCADERAARALQHLGILDESGDDPSGKLDRAACGTVELRCHAGNFFEGSP